MKSQSIACAARRAVTHAGAAAVEVVHADVVCFIDGRSTRRGARVHQVARHLGLAIDRHALAGQAEQVDAVALAAEAQVEAVVRQALGMHARAHAQLVEQIDRHLLQHAGADAAEHVLGAALFDDGVVDARLAEQGAQQQSRRTGAHDDDLGAHGGWSPVTRRDGRAFRMASAYGRRAPLNGRKTPGLSQFEHCAHRFRTAT